MVHQFSPIIFIIPSLAFIFIPSSVSIPVNPHPNQLPPSFKIPNGLMQQQRGCSYTVKIKTSCSSPRYTRDVISIAFGDVYRNEVFVPRLDDPSSHAFERCSTDTFKVQGPCGYGVCYLYLRREGWDGLVPESVKIYELSYGRAVTFYYGTPLPNAVWYGFNHCTRVANAANAMTAHFTDGKSRVEMLAEAILYV